MPVSELKPPPSRRSDRSDRPAGPAAPERGAIEGYSDRLRERPVETLAERRPQFGRSDQDASSDGDSVRRGLLLVVSSPSGAGKTTLARRLLRENPELRFSVSYTTRPRRNGEQDGVDYHYISDAEFDRMAEAGEFAEWCHVHSRRYGTARATLENALAAGYCVLLDIDYQGAFKLSQQFPDDSRRVFILPPSFQILAQRLRARGTDASHVIDARLNKARDELRHYGLYDYLVVNNQLDQAYAELYAIYQVERSLALGTPEPPAALVTLAAACEQQYRAAFAEEVLRSSLQPIGDSHPAP